MMDFQNQRRVEEEDEEMEEEEEEEDDDDDDDAPLPPTNYDSSVPNSSSRPFKMPNEPRSASPLPLSLSFPTAKRPARYRECLKNHAVGIGGHAVDGCCEFMPAGPEGSLDALKCAACNCHRNFHRKEVDPTVPQQIQSPPVAYYPHHPQQPPPAHPVLQFYPYGSRGGYPHQRPLALPSSSGGARRHGGGVETEEHEIILEPLSAMGLGMSSASALALGKKRHRTKFTAEQKEKMLGLAEKVGWRLQKQDEAVIQQFCDDSGIKRHVLKVWMHNNKHTLGKIRNPN